MSDDLTSRVAVLETTIRHTDATLIRMEGLLESRLGRMEGLLDTRLGQMDARLARLEGVLDTRLGRMDTRLDAMTNRVDRLFYWLLAASAAFAATLARGFHWF
jgi:hypothetical protein